MLAISIISGIGVIWHLSTTIVVDTVTFPVLLGVVFVIATWQLSLTLAIIGIVLTVIGFGINIDRK